MNRFIFCLVLIFAVGCTATTVIESDPQGAKVYINDTYEGVTPLATRFSDWHYTANIRIEKEGYETLKTIALKRTTVENTTTSAYAIGKGGYASGYGTSQKVVSKWPERINVNLKKIKKLETK